MNQAVKSLNETRIRSELNQAVTSAFHRQDLKCEILQNGAIIINNLGQVFVEYKPKEIQFNPNPEINENENIPSICKANSYPDAKISYEERGH